MKFESRQIITLILLFVTITGLLKSFSENVLCTGELPGAHEIATTSHLNDMMQIQDGSCPCAPSQSHPSDDHFCLGDCGCPCQAPLPSPSITLTYSRPYTHLYHAEPTRYIPEVYASLFVPPDSPTV